MNKIIKIQLKVALVIAAIFVLFLLFTSCKSKTVYVPVKETETQIYTVKDTVIDIQLVPYKDSIATKDTTNYLENKYAYSWARWSNGILSHSLGIFDIKLPIQIKYVDREVIRYKEIPIEVKGDTVYISQIKWWHEASLWFTTLVLVALALYLGIKYRGKIFSFFRKLIFKI